MGKGNMENLSLKNKPIKKLKGIKLLMPFNGL